MEARLHAQAEAEKARATVDSACAAEAAAAEVETKAEVLRVEAQLEQAARCRAFVRMWSAH